MMRPGSRRLPPILWFHALFSRPRHLRLWIGRFEAAGFESHEPAFSGRDPTDEEVLRRSGIPEYFETALVAREKLDQPPILIGHSLGGLIAQKLAAATDTAAMVLLAPVPPGITWTRPRTLPYLVPRLPAILAGRPILPPEAAFRAIPFSTLPRREQDHLVGSMVPDSGRVLRSMSFGSSPTRVSAGPSRARSCASAGPQTGTCHPGRTARSLAAMVLISRSTMVCLLGSSPIRSSTRSCLPCSIG